MKGNLLLIVLFISFSLIFSACSGDNEKSVNAQPANESQGVQQSQQLNPDNEGIAVAKEILDTFDKAVEEAAIILKEKPEAEILKTKLEALYKTYESKMGEINAKYLALKTKDIRLFGAANTYLGENRGKHVFKKDQVLGEYVSYYNFQKGDAQSVNLISNGIIHMLDVAVKQ